MDLTVPLGVTLQELEIGLNNEENAGFVLQTDGLALADDNTCNIVSVAPGRVPPDPLVVKIINAADATAAQAAVDGTHAQLAAKGGGVVSWGEMVIANQPAFVMATRAGGVKPVAEAPVAGTIIKKPGWDFQVEIEPNPDNSQQVDLVVKKAKATWFGGPHDSQDSGETASGIVNTRQHPDFEGCALPMDGAGSASTNGSPIPRLRWGTMVEVECLDTNRKITIPVIDLGPARSAGKALDLTEPAFEALGVSRGKGVMLVNFRIANLAAALHPKSDFTIQGLSTKKATTPQGDKIIPVTTDPAVGGLATLINSLGLANFKSNEVLESLARSRAGVNNEMPPANLWMNFVPTLCVLQRVRDAINQPLFFTSTYRSPAYNKAVGGAQQSQHMAFRASDVQAKDLSPHDLATAVRALRGKTITIPAGFDPAKVTAAGTPFDSKVLNFQPQANGTTNFVFHGGVGEYSTFVHVDTRGIDAEWS